MNIDVTLTPIQVFYYKCRFESHGEIKSKLLNEMESCVTEDHQTISKADWVTSTNTDREWIKTILPAMTSYMDVIGQAVGYKTPLITDIWFQQYQHNSFHTWHVHGGQFVGVYYLELEDDGPKTEFIEPITGRIVEFDVKEGDILVFPSSVVHRAPVNLNNSRKTIVSWNFNFNEPIIKES